MRHVFLIGFMASGKSTLGRMLAAALRRPFLDMDRELEKRLGAPVAEIFRARGEKFFRAEEAAFLREAAASERPAVIAAGGGAVENGASRVLFKKNFTFFLDAPPAITLPRLSEAEKARRPMLARGPAEAEELWRRREPLYRRAGRAIPAEGRPETVLELLLAALFPSRPIRLKAEGREGLIKIPRPASPADLAPELRGLTKSACGLMILDRAFTGEVPVWSELLPGFKVIAAARSGESLKTMDEAAGLWELMAKNGLARDGWLVARGGGALCDLGGFCAGLYRRGLNLALIPTTLLAAVDAAVGGKTAINHGGAKNQLGHFHLPRLVLADLAVISRSSPELINEGLVEAWKTGLLFDRKLADLVLQNRAALTGGDPPLLAEVVRRAASAKAALVRKDFREELGLREMLNLGHTYGHVLEAWHGRPGAKALGHGRAVAFGLAVMAELSAGRGLLKPGEAAAIKKTALLFGGAWPELPPRREALALLMKDKKIRTGRLRFVALAGPQKPVLIEAKPEEILAAGIQAKK